MIATKRYQAALTRLRQRTPRSQAARARGEKLLASEVVPTFSMPTPVYIDSAYGATMTDIDGNTYIDLAMGFGVQVLGHRPPSIEAAIQKQLEQGWHTVLPNTIQHDLAELLNAAVPCADLSILANSGTEATMYGFRVARAFSGKQKVAVFSGAYHGAHDYALVQDDHKSPETAPGGKLMGQGIPGVIRDQTVIVLPYHNDAAFELIRKHKDELAVVVIQPVQNMTPRIDNQQFLAELRKVCDECDVLLMFDEVVTGFRMAYGGGQSYYEVTPDLATFGKVMGGGTPVGALCGKAEVMSLFGTGGNGGVFSGGTFSGNPLTMAAAVATLSYLRDHQETIYPYLASAGGRLADAVNQYCQQEAMDVVLMHAGSIQCLHFCRGPIDNLRQALSANRQAEAAFYVHLLDRGVLVPGVHLYFLSTAHTEAQVGQVIDAFTGSLAECRADGLL